MFAKILRDIAIRKNAAMAETAGMINYRAIKVF